MVLNGILLITTELVIALPKIVITANPSISLLPMTATQQVSTHPQAFAIVWRQETTFVSNTTLLITPNIIVVMFWVITPLSCSIPLFSAPF